MNNRIGNLFKGDKVIWMVFFFLCMISVVEVFSASSGLTYKSQNYVGPIAYHAFTIMAGVVRCRSCYPHAECSMSVF